MKDKTEIKSQSKTKQEHPYKLDTKERKQLRSSDFGIPESKEFPMPDAVHVHSAEAYFRYAPEDKKPMLAHRIMMKAKKFGVDVESETIKEEARKYKP